MKRIVKDFHIIAWPVFILVMAAFVLGMASDPAQEELKDRELYCRMVKDQKWPDYRHTYKDECGGKNPPKFTKYQLTD